MSRTSSLTPGKIAMIVGCYSVDLYCDNSPMNNGTTCRGDKYAKVPQYAGETEAECLRQARKEGWRFTRDRPRKAYCPACSGKRLS